MIEQIVSGFPYKPEKGCFGFSSCILIRDSKNILFDTGGYNVRSVIKSYLNDIDCVVISHLHFDHCSNLDLFIEKKIPIYISTKELIFYNENKDNDFDLFSYFECIKDKLNIIEIDNVFQLSNKVKIIFTLGHTNGHISLEVVDGSNLVLLAGDSIKSYNDYIDKNSYGNAVNPKKYLDTKKIIKKKYDIIYPGHDSVIINGKRGIQMELRQF